MNRNVVAHSIIRRMKKNKQTKLNFPSKCTYENAYYVCVKCVDVCPRLLLNGRKFIKKSVRVYEHKVRVFFFASFIWANFVKINSIFVNNNLCACFPFFFLQCQILHGKMKTNKKNKYMLYCETSHVLVHIKLCPDHFIFTIYCEMTIYPTHFVSFSTTNILELLFRSTIILLLQMLGNYSRECYSYKMCCWIGDLTFPNL